MFKIIEGGNLPEPTRRLELASGATVEVEEDGAGELIRVHGTAGELVLEYDPKTKKTRLGLPEGDLELGSLGNIDLVAGGDVRVKAQRQVTFEAGDADRGGTATVGLSARTLSVLADHTELVSRRADLFFKEARWAGERFRGKVTDVRLVGQRLESVSDTVRSQAKRAYHTVEDVVQTRAGRVRNLVDDVVYTKARMLFFGADQDVKLEGKKIYLG